MKGSVRAITSLVLALAGAAALHAQFRVVGKFGRAQIQSRESVVHVLVVVPQGVDENLAALEALKRQRAVPIQSARFTTSGLVWDQFSNNTTDDDYVVQSYNPVDEPGGANGQSILENTQATWSGVPGSRFAFESGGTTDRCPSLVEECPGAQVFDGYNDVGWLDLGRFHPVFGGTLAVTWYGTQIDEADMALNTRFSWYTNGGDFDVETVMLHENGHVVGLGHSEIDQAVMYAYYQGVRRYLHADDQKGVVSLYPLDPDSCSTTEICDGLDNNCDGQIDEGFDVDGDGYTTCAGDCDDLDSAVNPGASEVCDDGLDNNCDGATDEGCGLCLDSGQYCSTDDQCCTGKCKGKPDAKTCK